MAIPIFRVSVSHHKQNFLPFSDFISPKVNYLVPKKRRLVSCTLSESKSVGSQVSFSVGTHLIPHPNKVDRGGEDAFFVSTYNGGVIAVADGVSGWAERNVDPALFSRELMSNASSFVEEVNDDPRFLIRRAHAATFSTGSATAIVAMLERNGILKIANVGDCGLRAVRKVCSVELMEGDAIIMGSDGLFDNIFDHEIVSTMASHTNVAEAGIS